jgi:hypothetical protein
MMEKAWKPGMVLLVRSSGGPAAPSQANLMVGLWHLNSVSTCSPPFSGPCFPVLSSQHGSEFGWCEVLEPAFFSSASLKSASLFVFAVFMISIHLASFVTPPNTMP